MAAWLEGSGKTAWSGFHALTVEDRYGIEFNGSFEEASSTCGTSGVGREAPIASPIGGHGDRDHSTSPYIGKVDVRTSRCDSFARPCEIILRRACISPFHHRESICDTPHATWRPREVQLLRLQTPRAADVWGPRCTIRRRLPLDELSLPDGPRQLDIDVPGFS